MSSAVKLLRLPGPPAACCPAPWWLGFFNFHIDTVMRIIRLLAIVLQKLGHLSEKPLLMSSFDNNPPASEDIEDISQLFRYGRGASSE